MSVRTLWTWEHEVARSPGRPRRRVSEEARQSVEMLLESEGPMGSLAAWHRLGRAPSLRAVRTVVKEWKLRRARAKRVAAGLRRRHVEEVVRDEGTREFLSVGSAVLASLEQAAAAHGWPLGLRIDNGWENVAAEVEARLVKEQVVVVKNAPRVPQHNPRAERGMRELKEVSGLGKGRVVVAAEAEACLEAACRVLNEKPRGCLGWKSAQEACAEMPGWYSRGDREEIYSVACAARKAAMRNAKGKCAQRAAEREAHLAILERFKIIKRWRGNRKPR